MESLWIFLPLSNLFMLVHTAVMIKRTGRNLAPFFILVTLLLIGYFLFAVAINNAKGWDGLGIAVMMLFYFGGTYIISLIAWIVNLNYMPAKTKPAAFETFRDVPPAPEKTLAQGSLKNTARTPEPRDDWDEFLEKE